MSIFFKLLLVIKNISNFHIAILDRLGLINGTVTYVMRKDGARYIARGGTEDVAEIAVVASGYEYGMQKLIVSDKPTIIDIGGHIGTFSIYVAKYFLDTCRIFAYEPNKENYKLLVKNISNNKVKSISTQNIAISDYNGKGYLKEEGLNNDAYYLDFTEEKKVNCEIRTLKSIVDDNSIKNIDILKMDIEGGEYKLFKDAATYNIIRSKVHYIFLEYHNLDKNNNFATLKKILTKNFRIISHQRSSVTLANKNWK